MLRPVFWSVKGLTEYTGVTVLGAVSAAFPGIINRRRRWDLTFYSLFAGGFVLLAAVVLGLSALGGHLQIPPHLGKWL
jgi:hypothetical protein